MNDLCVAAVVMTSRFGEIDVNLEKIGKFATIAAGEGARIVCFPEMCITGYALRKDIEKFAEQVPGPSTREIQRIAAENDIIIVGGLAERTGGSKVSITQLIAFPDGELGTYRKVHLSTGERELFAAGDEAPVFRTGETTFAVQLCYDAHFPELSTVLALKGAEVLFVPHASPPPESAEEKRARWLRYLSARAYDNSVFLVACNQTGEGREGVRFSGVALILDPRGEILAATSGDEEEVLIADLKAELLERIRNTRMGFFLPQRRPDVYRTLVNPVNECTMGSAQDGNNGDRHKITEDTSSVGAK
jgi:predicted amidohydrolase